MDQPGRSATAGDLRLSVIHSGTPREVILLKESAWGLVRVGRPVWRRPAAAEPPASGSELRGRTADGRSAVFRVASRTSGRDHRRSEGLL